MAYVLDYQYSLSSLSFEHLKGKDLAIAEALRRLYEKNAIELYLGTVEKWEEGHAEGGRRNDWSMGDVFSTVITCKNMVDVKG